MVTKLEKFKFELEIRNLEIRNIRIGNNRIRNVRQLSVGLHNYTVHQSESKMSYNMYMHVHAHDALL